MVIHGTEINAITGYGWGGVYPAAGPEFPDLRPGRGFQAVHGMVIFLRADVNTIIDNGRGIPPEQLEKIFDPYFTTKSTFSEKGLGLGLAICYWVMKKHNGHIAVQSQVGVGTTVELYLPASQ